MRKSFLAVLIMTMMLSKPAFSTANCPEGTTLNTDCWDCGTNCTAVLDGGVLTISGSGSMTEYPAYWSSPWYDRRLEIQSIIVEGSKIDENGLPIPNTGITSLGKDAFYGAKNLTSITIPDSVTYIGTAAIGECSSLTSVTIPDTVHTIGNSVFYKNYGLTSIVIPDSVTSIGDHAFEDATNLNSIVIGDKVTVIFGGSFAKIPSDAKIYCQDTTKDRCANLINYQNSAHISKLVLFTKDENGFYEIDGVYYASTDDMFAGSSCGGTIAQCQAFLASNEAAGSSVNNTTGQLVSTRGKRIYTVEEASKLSKETGNTIKLRYK